MYEEQQRLLDEVSALYQQSKLHENYLELVLDRCYDGYAAALDATTLFASELDKWERLLAESTSTSRTSSGSQSAVVQTLSLLQQHLNQFKKVRPCSIDAHALKMCDGDELCLSFLSPPLSIHHSSRVLPAASLLLPPSPVCVCAFVGREAV